MPRNMYEIIIERIEGLKCLINEKFDNNAQEHLAIKERVEKTNGRVKRLEIWKAYLIGAWAVLSVIVAGVAVPMLSDYINNKASVEEQVSRAMGVYLEKK